VPQRKATSAFQQNPELYFAKNSEKKPVSGGVSLLSSEKKSEEKCSHSGGSSQYGGSCSFGSKHEEKFVSSS
jgi:hypothetical protein